MGLFEIGQGGCFGHCVVDDTADGVPGLDFMVFLKPLWGELPWGGEV